MKTAAKNLQVLIARTEERAAKAEQLTRWTDLEAGEQFALGCQVMMRSGGAEGGPKPGTPEHREAMIATFACMVHDLRAAERLRMKRES
jgi:hypothetical protein